MPHDTYVVATAASDSKPNLKYNVSVKFEGASKQPTSAEWQCACPDWTRHMPRRDCKHITRSKNVMKGLPASRFYGVTFTAKGDQFAKQYAVDVRLQSEGKVGAPTILPSAKRAGKPKRFGRR